MARRADNKDMEVLREGDQTKDQRDKRRGVLKDYSLKHKVVVEWDMNDASIRDAMFKLTVGENTVILDGYEVLRLLRWV